MGTEYPKYMEQGRGPVENTAGVTVIKDLIMSVLGEDELRPSMQPELCYLLT